MFIKMMSFFSAILISGLLSVSASTDLSGTWRFVLKAEHAKIPFLMEIQKGSSGLSAEIFNGRETIPLENLRYDEKSKRLHIPLQTFEQSLELELKGKRLTGYHVRHNKKPEVKTPITGEKGVTERFPETNALPKASVDLTGRWKVELIDNASNSTGIVVFTQNGEKLDGSILTPTGDYRYFSGYVTGRSFVAASFDGVFNYLYKGEIKDGKLRSALLANYKTEIIGERNNTATLPDAYKQTELPSLEFSFPDLEGKMVSLSDARFKNKPVIVQFFGSWCPNCIDELNFLVPWYKENAKKGIEAVALAFERSLDEKASLRQLKKIKDKKKVPYPILVAGLSADVKPADKIKGLKNFISFPTTIFLNKKHEVVKVHAGFTGPGTGEFYEQWKNEFYQTVGELLAE